MTLLEEGESRSCTTETSNWVKREKCLDISWTGQSASWLLSLRHLQMKQRGCLEMKSINNWRSAPSRSSHCVARIQRSILWGENSHMERGNRMALRNWKESATHSVHCLHKRVQVKVHLLYAHYRFVWGLCRSNPGGDWRPTSSNQSLSLTRCVYLSP